MLELSIFVGLLLLAARVLVQRNLNDTVILKECHDEIEDYELITVEHTDVSWPWQRLFMLPKWDTYNLQYLYKAVPLQQYMKYMYKVVTYPEIVEVSDKILFKMLYEYKHGQGIYNQDHMKLREAVNIELGLKTSLNSLIKIEKSKEPKKPTIPAYSPITRPLHPAEPDIQLTKKQVVQNIKHSFMSTMENMINVQPLGRPISVREYRVCEEPAHNNSALSSAARQQVAVRQERENHRLRASQKRYRVELSHSDCPTWMTQEEHDAIVEEALRIEF